jgi:hypothetical protein
MGSWGLNLDSTDVNSWTCERINEGYVDGLQLPEPELDVVQAASTNPLEPEPKLDGDHLPESELNGVQASGMHCPDYSITFIVLSDSPHCLLYCLTTYYSLCCVIIVYTVYLADHTHI